MPPTGVGKQAKDFSCRCFKDVGQYFILISWNGPFSWDHCYALTNSWGALQEKNCVDKAEQWIILYKLYPDKKIAVSSDVKIENVKKKLMNRADYL